MISMPSSFEPPKTIVKLMLCHSKNGLGRVYGDKVYAWTHKQLALRGEVLP